MKKLLVLLICLLICLLVGCQQQQVENTDNQMENTDNQVDNNFRIIEDNTYRIIIVDFDNKESRYLNSEDGMPEEIAVNIVKENGYILVPICEIAEAFGYSVIWKNQNSLVINGEEIDSPVPVDQQDSLVLAPLIVVQDSLGLSIEMLDNYTEDLLIWISQYPLLTDQDVEVTDDYTIVADAFYDYYELKLNGETIRGIAIGSTKDELQEAYGNPFRIDTYSGDWSYIGKVLPYTEAGQWLAFSVENDIVVNVSMGNNF